MCFFQIASRTEDEAGIVDNSTSASCITLMYASLHMRRKAPCDCLLGVHCYTCTVVLYTNIYSSVCMRLNIKHAKILVKLKLFCRDDNSACIYPGCAYIPSCIYRVCQSLMNNVCPASKPTFMPMLTCMSTSA